MDDWENFNERKFPGKEELYSDLNVEDNADADYIHAKRVSKDIKGKKIRRIS